MNRYFFALGLLLLLIAACTTEIKKDSEDTQQTNSPMADTADSPAPQVTQSKFITPQELIREINKRMGLGPMDPWTNKAGGFDMGEYISTLEYQFGTPIPHTSVKNQIELTIGSKDKLGSTVEYVKIDVGFMNPSEKASAKKLYQDKVKLISSILNIQIPDEIYNAVKAEQTHQMESGGFVFEHEKYGGTREFLGLTIR